MVQADWLEAVKHKYNHYNGVGKSKLYGETSARTLQKPWDHPLCTNRVTVRGIDSNKPPETTNNQIFLFGFDFKLE